MMPEFRRDNAWQLPLAEKFLDPLYRSRGWLVERYPGDHPMQRRHVDVTLSRHDRSAHNIDEKIIRGLRKGTPAEKINIETWSCSVPGKERPGWISPDELNDATVLFVCNSNVSDLADGSWKKVTHLDCVWIPFQLLRDWFWRQGEERWKRNDNNQPNRSISRKVPIKEIMAAVSGCRRFTVTAPAPVSAVEPEPT